MKLNLSKTLALAVIAVTAASQMAMAQVQTTTTGAANVKQGAGVHQGHRKMTKEEFQARRAEREAKFAKELNLTSEQQQKIKSIRESFFAKHKPQMEAKRAEIKKMKAAGASREDIMAKFKPTDAEKQAMKAEHQAMKAQIKAVLTPEQQTKFDAMIAQHKGKKHHRGDKGGFKGGVAAPQTAQ